MLWLQQSRCPRKRSDVCTSLQLQDMRLEYF
jgi:hypothetical protein